MKDRWMLLHAVVMNLTAERGVFAEQLHSELMQRCHLLPN